MSYEYNGRPVHMTIAFDPLKARTAKVYEFAQREFTTNGEGLLRANFGSDLIKGVSVEVPPQVCPVFNYPVFISEELGVVIDGRNLRKKDNSVSNSDEMGNLVIEATLEYTWNTDINKFKGVSQVTSVIFGSWLTSAFKSRLGIDELTQMQCRAIFSFYYWLRFKSLVEYANLEMSDLETGFYTLANTHLRLPPNIIDGVYDNPAFKDILDHIVEWKYSEFDGTLLNLICTKLPDLFTNTSLRTFSQQDLLNVVIGRTWLGARNNDLTIAALEHPPVLMTMVTIADVKASFYQNTYIGQVIKALKAIRISSGDVSKLTKDLMLDLVERQRIKERG